MQEKQRTIPKEADRRFTLTGEVVGSPKLHTLPNGTKYAEFPLKTEHQGKTGTYERTWQIRASNKLVPQVEEQIDAGQTGVEVVVYGPKISYEKKRTFFKEKKAGLNPSAEQVVFYYAGYINVPEDELPYTSHNT